MWAFNEWALDYGGLTSDRRVKSEGEGSSVRDHGHVSLPILSTY